jgi:hypothetical protein
MDNTRKDGYERNTDIPIYYWIRQKGSINKLNSNSRINHKIIGWHIVNEVLKRYYRLKKVKPTAENFNDSIVETATYRYRSDRKFVLDNFFRVTGHKTPNDFFKDLWSSKKVAI